MDPMPVRIRGVDYPNAREAAKALKVKQVSIYCAISKGTVDTVGLGKGKCKKNPRGGNPKPITLAGIEFPSLQAASKALGFSRGYLQNKFSKPGSDRQNLAKAIMEMTAKDENKLLRANLRGGI